MCRETEGIHLPSVLSVVRFPWGTTVSTTERPDKVGPFHNTGNKDIGQNIGKTQYMESLVLPRVSNFPRGSQNVF